MKRSIFCGMRIKRIHRLAVAVARELKRDREAEIWNERKRMRRVDRERRQQRKDVGEEILFQPRLLVFGQIVAVDQNDAGRREQRPQFKPAPLLIDGELRDGFADAA